MEITTTHRATVQYIYTDAVSYAQASEITERLSDEVSAICKQFEEVRENTDFRCQAYGFEMESENLGQLEEAAAKFDEFLLYYVGQIEIIE